MTTTYWILIGVASHAVGYFGTLWIVQKVSQRRSSP